MEALWDMTIGDLLDKQAADYPEQEAVVYPHEGFRYTYAQFRDVCNETARGLLAMGVRKGDHVAIWATNVKEWLIAQFSTAKIGAVLVTVNTNYKQYELEYLLRQSDASTLILIDGGKDSNYVECVYTLNPMLAESEPGRLENPRLPRLKNIIYIGEAPKAGMYHWPDIQRLAARVDEDTLRAYQRAADPHDVINMQYTSGTTGFPKGVMLTHYNIVNNGKAIGDCMRLSENDRLCIPVPLFHCFGCVLGVMACVTHATTMVMLEYFQPLKVMQAVEREKCTGLHGVPTMFIAILNHEAFNKTDFSTLRTGIMAGSPCPIEVMKRVNSEMHLNELTIAFGQTESSPVMAQTRFDDSLEKRVSTVGRVLPHMEVKIVDVETGKDLGPNMNGEIVTRGYHIMKGYYNMPEATKLAIDENGWLHTGDQGLMDEDGYFKITGRLKDMIIRGGENVYPREIEEYLYTHPAVRDVQVVGVPDEKYGEEVLAFVIPNDGAGASEEALIEYVRQGLSRFKKPRYVRFIDSFPMTASGKIQKYKLREMGIELLNLQDAANIETA